MDLGLGQPGGAISHSVPQGARPFMRMCTSKLTRMQVLFYDSRASGRCRAGCSYTARARTHCS